MAKKNALAKVEKAAALTLATAAGMVEQGIMFLANEISKAEDAATVVHLREQAKSWEKPIKDIIEIARRMMLDTMADGKMEVLNLEINDMRYAVKRQVSKHAEPDQELLREALEKKGKSLDDVMKEEIHIVLDMEKVKKLFKPAEIEAMRKVKSEALRVEKL